MKLLLFLFFIFPAFFASAQIEPTLDPESNVVNLLANNQYESAVDYLHQLMKDDRNGSLPWFLLAGVYLRSDEFCGGDLLTDYLLASLAYKIYWEANERFHKHDPGLLREICEQLPLNEYLLDEGITENTVFPLNCYNEEVAIVSSKTCLQHFKE